MRVRGAPVRQKLGMILENKVVQILISLKWKKKNLKKFVDFFDIENWLWKYDLGTFWQTVIHRQIKKILWVFLFLAKRHAFKTTILNLKFHNGTGIRLNMAERKHKNCVMRFSSTMTLPSYLALFFFSNYQFPTYSCL